MEEKAASPNNTNARFAGLLYLLMGITGAYGIMYVPSQIMVQGNVAATVRNILAHEFLFRTGIVSLLASTILFMFLVLALYRLLKRVNEKEAKLMVALVFVQVPIAFAIETFNITSLMILKDEIMTTFEPEQKQDFVMLFLNIHKYGTMALEIFWGLWLIPFGQLVYKSGFIPWILGVLIIIGGLGYIIESCTSLLFPNYQSFVSHHIFVTYAIGEISIMLWLLIKGAKASEMKFPIFDKSY